MNIPQRAILMLTLGVSAMYVFYWLCMCSLVRPLSEKHQWTSSRFSAVSLMILYLPGLLLLWLFIKDLPLVPLPATRFSLSDYLLVFLAQFFSLALMALGTILENKARGKALSLHDKKQQYQTVYNYVHLLLLVPLLEELLARGLLGARTAGMDMMGFLLLSALVFSLIHLQTGRLAVAVGMYWNGLLWAWVYGTSGSFLVSALFHGMYNLLATCLPERIEKGRSERAMSLYMGLLLLTGTAGAVVLLLRIKHFLGDNWLNRAGMALGALLANQGVWVLTLVCILSYAFKRSSLARNASET